MSYHTINEEAARRANGMTSFRDYKAGSATAEYRRMVDAASELAERQKQRQVVHRAGLAHIGGGKVDGNAPVREAEAKVFDGGAHPVGAFPHGRVRQADDGKRGQPAGNIGFHRNGKAAQPVQAKAVGHRIHGVPPCMAHGLSKMLKVENNGYIFHTSTVFSV